MVILRIVSAWRCVYGGEGGIMLIPHKAESMHSRVVSALAVWLRLRSSSCKDVLLHV